jgi:hypothetical protein
MRGWITVTLLLTFVSGGVTGLAVGRQTAPKPKKVEWYDGHIEQLRAEGVTDAQALEDARQVYIWYEERVRQYTDKVKESLETSLKQINEEAERRIQAIRNRFAGGKR